MLIIAHRGANREALENTKSAFEKAIEAGASRIELDIFLTKDNHFVVTHDESLKRMDGTKRYVTQLERDELSKIVLQNGESLLFLDEVMDKIFPHVEINIEIKAFHKHYSTDRSFKNDHYQFLVDQLVKVLQRYSVGNRVIVSSFELAPLIYLSSALPGLALACLWSKVFGYPFYSLRKVEYMMDQCCSQIFHPRVNLVNSRIMKQAKANGWKVYPYAPMDLDETDELWESLMGLGVDGLCTNCPRELKAYLDKVGR